MSDGPGEASEDLCLVLREDLAGRTDELVELTQRLVCIPSVNPKFLVDPPFNRESDVQDLIEGELRALGFATHRGEPLPAGPT